MESPSLLDRLFGRPYTTQKNVFGKTIEFRILTNQERVEIWKQHPVNNLLTAPESIAVPTLARSIVSIDSIRWEKFSEVVEARTKTPGMAVVEAVEKYLETVPFPVVMELYAAYTEVVDDLQGYLNDLKKSSETPNQGRSGDSARSSGEAPQNSVKQ